MMVVVVMMMVVVCFLDEEAGTGETAADGFLGFQDHLFREVKGLDGFLKKGQGMPRSSKAAQNMSPLMPEGQSRWRWVDGIKSGY